MKFVLLQDDKLSARDNDPDPFLNELPKDDNAIVQKRVSDVVITPLKVRMRREAIFQEQQKLIDEEKIREKREAIPHRGRFRGQTQSQYLSVGANGQKEGKAEAEATQQSSRAVVSECVLNFFVQINLMNYLFLRLVKKLIPFFKLILSLKK